MRISHINGHSIMYVGYQECIKKDSPHNEWIDWQYLLTLLGTEADIVAEHREYSQFRHLMVKALYNKIGITGKQITKLIIALDNLWLTTIGRCHKSLGPSAIHYAIRKR
jgi:hypothetical protein